MATTPILLTSYDAKRWARRVHNDWDPTIEKVCRAYLTDALLQEAGDSLMMKLGEAANRGSRSTCSRPTANTIHDESD